MEMRLLFYALAPRHVPNTNTPVVTSRNQNVPVELGEVQGGYLLLACFYSFIELKLPISVHLLNHDISLIRSHCHGINPIRLNYSPLITLTDFANRGIYV